MTGQQAQRTTALVIDLVFKAAVTIGLGIAGWLFSRIEAHEARIIRMESKADGASEKFTQLFDAVERLDHKLDQVIGWTRTRGD